MSYGDGNFGGNDWQSKAVPPVAKLPPGSLSQEDRTWGMLAHLSGLIAGALGGMSFLGPLLIWLIKKDQSQFVADQAKEALNFQLSALIAAIVCAVTIIGMPLALVIAIGALIYSIIAGIEANKGVYYRYPYTFRMIS